MQAAKTTKPTSIDPYDMERCQLLNMELESC